MSDYLNHADNETKEMLASFVDETLEALDKFEPQIDNLTSKNNFDSVNAIFRVFHTIKGLAGFFGLAEIARLTHQAETLLDRIREKNEPQNELVVNLIYNNFDLIRKLIANVLNKQTDKGFEIEIDAMINKLKSISGLDTVSTSLNLTNNINEEIDQEELLIFDDIITEELLKEFITDCTGYLNQAEQVLIAFESSSEKEKIINDAFGFVHSIKGNAGFLGLATIESESKELENLLGKARENLNDFTFNDINNSFAILDRISNNLKKLGNKLFNDKNKKSVTTGKPVQNNESKQKEPELKKGIQLSTESVDNEKTSQKNLVIKTEKKQIFNSNQIEKQESANSTAKQTPSQKKDIRVDTQKLDSLFDLVGELITIETMITNNVDLEGMELPNFSKATAMLGKITRELQEISMSLRMTPVDGLFNKMKRLVRDLAQKSDKKVDLELYGEDTEMDKNVIEEISDPLVHIIRNAIDHGIEKPDLRIAKRKPAAGHLTIGASYEGNEIIIKIEDDGNGLDREKIEKKIIEKGLAEASDISKLSDHDIWDYVFKPGFSTAEKVTDISGRGVGMDVVRKNIEKLRGNVSIESFKGKGSQFKLKIPLTLAIMDSMLATINTTTYAIPILSIQESFQPKQEDIIITMDGNELVKIRGKIYPVIRTHNFLGKIPKYTKFEEGIFIRVISGNLSACLFVDEIVGQQQTVIKGMSDYIGKVPGITGGMILGNGEVGLILDIDTILKKFVNL